MKTELIVLAVLTATPAMAPSPSRAREPAQPSAYCTSAAQVLAKGSGDAEMEAVAQRCRIGDTIAISSAAEGSVFQVARLCDFTRPVVTMGTQIVCVLGPVRSVR